MKILKKTILFLLAIIFSFFLFSFKTSAKEVNVYVFYGQTCPHCHDAFNYLESIKDKYELNIIKYEVWYNQDNKQKMIEVAELLDVSANSVPFVVINNRPIFGYSKGVTDDAYLYNIRSAKKAGFVDEVGIKLGLVEEKRNVIENDRVVEIPLIGKVDIVKENPYLISVVLGFFEGFNLNFIWIMLLVILLLLGIKDSKKRKLITLCFLISMFISYILFIILKIDYSKMLNLVSLSRVVFSFSLILLGIFKLNVYDNNKKLMKILLKIKIPLIIISIIFIGISATGIILSCSKGFYTVFNMLLLSSNIETFKMILLIVLFILFLTLFPMLIFSLLMVMSKILERKIENKFILKVITTLLIFLISILLMAKPDIFNL